MRKTFRMTNVISDNDRIVNDEINDDIKSEVYF